VTDKPLTAVFRIEYQQHLWNTLWDEGIVHLWHYVYQALFWVKMAENRNSLQFLVKVSHIEF
jgi:hypothetical protein